MMLTASDSSPLVRAAPSTLIIGRSAGLKIFLAASSSIATIQAPTERAHATWMLSSGLHIIAAIKLPTRGRLLNISSGQYSAIVSIRLREDKRRGLELMLLA